MSQRQDDFTVSGAQSDRRTSDGLSKRIRKWDVVLILCIVLVGCIGGATLVFAWRSSTEMPLETRLMNVALVGLTVTLAVWLTVSCRT